MIFLESTASAEESVAGQRDTVQMLVDAGAQHILIPRLWPPEILPLSLEWFPLVRSENVLEYDTLLDQELEAIKARHEVAFYRPDLFQFLTAVWNNPSAYGFRQPLSTDFSCDRLHFNSPVHRLNAQQMYRALTPQLRIDSAVRTPGGGVVLNWSGGSPPFRIERTTDLLSGDWEPVGEPAFPSSATIQSASPKEFFRVLNLGQ